MTSHDSLNSAARVSHERSCHAQAGFCPFPASVCKAGNKTADKFRYNSHGGKRSRQALHSP